MACGQVALIATPASRTHVASAERPPVLFGTPGRQSWCARSPITKRPAAGLLSSDGQNSPEALDDFFIHSRESRKQLSAHFTNSHLQQAGNKPGSAASTPPHPIPGAVQVPEGLGGNLAFLLRHRTFRDFCPGPRATSPGTKGRTLQANQKV